MQDHPAFTSHRARIAEDILCAASYLTPLPAAAMLVLPRTARNRRIRTHACQSILLNWLMLSFGFLLHLRAGLDQLLNVGSGARFEWTARILCMAVWSLIALRLARGHELSIPLLTRLAERQADGLLFRRISPVRPEPPAVPSPRFKQIIQLSN